MHACLYCSVFCNGQHAVHHITACVVSVTWTELNTVQVISRAAEEAGLCDSEANALHTEMLECMLHDVYAMLNRRKSTACLMYQPEPPRRRLPEKEKLKCELLGKISSHGNLPYEPPQREGGGDEAIELHRCHLTKHLAASLESCSLRSRKTLVSDGSKLLMAIADDLFDLLTMETVKNITDLDLHVDARNNVPQIANSAAR
jgi:hypothetical protein